MLLGQDGITNGAIYALLALSIILVFTVTRILLIPLGEFVTFGALTMYAFQSGQDTSIVWLLMAMMALDAGLDLKQLVTNGMEARKAQWIGLKLAYAVILAILVETLPMQEIHMAGQVLLTLLILVPLGPIMYRIFFFFMVSTPAALPSTKNQI